MQGKTPKEKKNKLAREFTTHGKRQFKSSNDSKYTSVKFNTCILDEWRMRKEKNSEKKQTLAHSLVHNNFCRFQCECNLKTIFYSVL